MAKHIRLFKNLSDYEVAKDNLDLPNVSYVEENKKVTYHPLLPDPSNGHEYVDLGLSVKWATCNVGATKPEEYGLYFAWGETDGYTGITDTKKFNWSDYKYGDGGTSETNLTKYNSTDNLTTLELTDDAAHVNMGGNWRMPTYDECQELIDNTTTAWTTVNGVYGTKFTSTKEGYTDKYIFVPAAGNCDNGSVHRTGSYGNLWSSSLTDSYNVNHARFLLFSSSYASASFINRYSGFSVRAVLE